MASVFAPLLGGETSRAGRKPFNRRSDAIAYGSPYQKAAALVDLAEDGSGLPEEILELPNIETAAKFYFIFIRFDIIWTLNYFALIALNFFEKPLWCSSVFEVSCSNRDYYYLGELPYLTNAESLAFEGVTLIILVVHTLFPILYEGGQLYWKNHVNKLKKTFGEYTERTSFERPLTSGVAYALRVRHSEREKFEKEHGWTIKKMDTEDQDQTLAQYCQFYLVFIIVPPIVFTKQIINSFKFKISMLKNFQ